MGSRGICSEVHYHRMANLEQLFERAEAELHGLRRRKAKTQEVLELPGVRGIAWRPLVGSQVLQVCPPTKGRQAFRDGDYLVVKSATSEWRYFDPHGKLDDNRWSYVGCDCSTLPDADVWDFIKQAYKYALRDKELEWRGRATNTSRWPHPDAKTQVSDSRTDKILVVGIESAYRPDDDDPAKRLCWIGPLRRAVQEVPRGVQGKRANRLLAEALERVGLRWRGEVTVGQGSKHAVDFLIECNHDKVGVELGTGQGERVELDLLKLINLALCREINYACLILPRDLLRHSVMGRYPMKLSISSLVAMCSPLLDLVSDHLGDIVIIWYA